MNDLLSLAPYSPFLLFIPVVVFFGTRNAWSARWGWARAEDRVQGEGAYRQTSVPTWKKGTAPVLVLLASFTCFLLGQMVLFTPGALLGLFFVGNPTMLVSVLSAPTGAVVAVKLFRAGDRMLLNAPGATDRARNAARWALAHNGLLLLALAAVQVWAPASEGSDFSPFRLATAEYAVVSILQAALVLAAARSLTVHNRTFTARAGA